MRWGGLGFIGISLIRIVRYRGMGWRVNWSTRRTIRKNTTSLPGVLRRGCGICPMMKRFVKASHLTDPMFVG